jgi:nucleoside-diphosphate-sugar epimerase
MRVVITGASGNVGTALVERLGEDDAVEQIVGVCRREHDWRPKKTSWVYADVASDDLTETLRGADAVVHLAWLFHPTRHPEETWRGNVLGTEAVLRAVERAEVPALVVASSVGAYSPRTGLDPVDESWPTNGCPTAAYSREKAFVERLLDIHEQRFPERRVVRIRPAFTFQAQSATQQRRIFLGPLVPGFVFRPGVLPVVPLPRGLHLQLAHTADVADAYAAALIRPVRGAFNIAADPPLSGGDLGQLLESRTIEVPPTVVRGVLGAAFRLHAVPATGGLLDLALSIPMMSTERARTELEWSPTRDASDALHAFLDGLQADASAPTPPLAKQTSGPLRSREFATGVGAED